MTLASPAAAQAPRVPLGTLGSEAKSVRFGIEQVCLPAVRDRSLGEAFFDKLVPFRGMVYPGQRSWYVSPQVTVSTDGKTCSVRAMRGKGDALRQGVLDVLAEQGAKPRVVSDNGPNSRSSSGKLYRQEQHCLDLAGRPGGIVISSSADGAPPLQATILDDPGLCARLAP